MTVWFSSASVVALVKQSQDADGAGRALLTSSLQVGFVIGTHDERAAVAGRPLRPAAPVHDSRARGGGGHGVAGVLMEPTGLLVYAAALSSPGMCMAGVYPVGMRLAATWARGDLGLMVGLLVGALTLGSASPHALTAGGPARLAPGVRRGRVLRGARRASACCFAASGRTSRARPAST
jgi:hypothetical protein